MKPLLALLSLLLLWLPDHSSGYLVLAPKTFRRGTEYNVQVSVENVASPVNVIGNLKSLKQGSNLNLASSVTVTSGSTKSLIFQIPNDAVEGSYELSVNGNGGQTFENKTTVSRASEDVLLLVQTDKAIYKPNQVIKLRVFGIDSAYKIVKRPITVSIIDKNGNLLSKFKDETDPSGVISLEYPLSDEPPLGDWTVQADMDGGSQSHKFKVDEYVLPKFEVTTKILPNFLIYGNQGTELSVNVKAKYTYGENVVGKVVIKVKTDTVSSTKTMDINGEVTVPFTLEEMIGSDSVNELMRPRYFYYPWQEKKARVYVNVTETARQISIVDDAEAKLYTYPKKIHLEPLNALKVYHPGLPVKIRVRVTDPSGAPLSTYGMTVKVKGGNVEKNVVVNNAVGEVVEFETTDIKWGFRVEGSIEGDKQANTAYLNLDKYSTTGTTVMMVSDMQGETSKTIDLDAQQNLNLKVKATGSMSLVSYMVVSKGEIKVSGNLDLSSSMEQPLSVPITADMSPSANLVVYGITGGKTNEVLVDVFEIALQNGMKNKVTLSFSAPELRPGSDVSLTVNSDAQSDIFVLGVDKSVLLLATGNDITQDSVMDDFNMFTGEKKKEDNDMGIMPRPIPFARKKRALDMPAYGDKNADILLTAAGLTSMTDKILNKSRSYYHGIVAFAGGVDANIKFKGNVADGIAENDRAPMSGVGGTTQPLAEVGRVRKFFPETWLWLNGRTGMTGDITFRSKVPDTITSWRATAFSISPTNGLGLTSVPAKLNAFQPFFLSLNLPYSIRRGEVFQLLAAVNNYIDQDVSVRVTLEESLDFAVENPNSIEPTYVHQDMIEEIQVPRQSSASVRFMIQAKKLGEIVLSVKAQPRGTSEQGDQVKKTVIVEPEGYKYVNNIGLTVDLNETSSLTDTVQLLYPNETVSGSKRVEVKVTGDVMGPAIDGLDNLLQVPSGCGEQNMISLVPNIFVMNYLESVGKVTEEIKKKAIANMNTGRGREYNYEHDDGSFSAFGREDDSGSTWLSAFVIRSFSQASKYITISPTKQAKTINWLMSQQLPSGAFKEPGRVIHVDMMGDAAEKIGLAAYVLISILESKEFMSSSQYNKATSATTTYLEGLLDNNEITKQYDKAIVAYALTLAGSPKANILLKELQGGKKWDSSDNQGTTGSANRKTMSHYSKSTSSDVEIWSYVVLSYAKKRDITNCRPIIKWLIGQFGPTGGFRSTQDTVVGLQALAAYAELVSNAPKDLTIKITSGALQHTFIVNADNSLLFQSYVLPEDTTEVDVEATGVGMAIVNVVWRFYSKLEVPSLIPQNGPNKAPINLSKATKILNDKEVSVVTCVSCEKDIGMSTIMVGLVSGHEPKDLDKIRQQNLIKRAEYKDNVVTMYLDEIPRKETCFNVELVQNQKIENIQDAPISASAYYQTEVTSRVLYNINEDSQDFCDMCKGCTGCPTSTAATRWNTAAITASTLICVLLALLFSM